MLVWHTCMRWGAREEDGGKTWGEEQEVGGKGGGGVGLGVLWWGGRR